MHNLKLVLAILNELERSEARLTVADLIEAIAINEYEKENHYKRVYFRVYRACNRLHELGEIRREQIQNSKRSLLNLYYVQKQSFLNGPKSDGRQSGDN